MTKEQIKMLKELIRSEIDYTRWSSRRQPIDKKWEEFAETFNSTPTEPLEIDV